MGKLERSIELLKETASKHDAVSVGLSGGKDSLVTLALCLRYFKRVEPFFMQLVPGIEFERQMLESALSQFPGLKLTVVTHWALRWHLENGIFCRATRRLPPELTQGELWQVARAKTKCPITAVGYKRSDDPARRKEMIRTKHMTDRIYPIAEWSNRDVVEFCEANSIVIPDTGNQVGFGIDTNPARVCWLYDNHPGDFERLAEWFPFIRASVARRRIYGETRKVRTYKAG